MCPNCDSIKSHSLATAFDSEGRRVRDRQCKDCGIRYTTIEVPIPIAFSRVAASKRDYRRVYQRIKSKFRGVQARKPYVAPVVDVRVTVRDPIK